MGQRLPQGVQQVTQVVARLSLSGVRPELKSKLLTGLGGVVMQYEVGEQCLQAGGGQLVEWSLSGIRNDELESDQQAHVEYRTCGCCGHRLSLLPHRAEADGAVDSSMGGALAHRWQSCRQRLRGPVRSTSRFFSASPMSARPLTAQIPSTLTPCVAASAAQLIARV